MKVALIQLPHFYGKGLSRSPNIYPYGLGYISNALKEEGIDHEAVDLWAENLSVEDSLQKKNFEKYDIFAISAYITQYRYLKEFSLELKKRYPDVPIICGGPGPTFSPHIILPKTGVDICVLSEGEVTIVELLQNLNNLGSVKGIVFIQDGEIKRTAPRTLIPDLDKLPFPNWDTFNMNDYIKVRGEQVVSDDNPEEVRVANVIAGRGCPYQCHYCSKTFDGYRLRSIDNVIAEIVELIEKYKIKKIGFNDELFIVNKKRILEFCEKLEPLNIKWDCQGRINQVDEEILIKMKKAGCVSVGYGVESVSQHILDKMNKKIKVENIVPVIKMTKKVGMNPLIQYMYGYPGENDTSIKNTVKFFKEIDSLYLGFSTTAIPGTKLYDDCLSKGIIKDEEDYILRLDSGYNVEGSLINMTDFSDEQFVQKKRLLKLRVNHNYYIKRPIQYAAYVKKLTLAALKKVMAR